MVDHSDGIIMRCLVWSADRILSRSISRRRFPIRGLACGDSSLGLVAEDDVIGI